MLLSEAMDKEDHLLTQLIGGSMLHLSDDQLMRIMVERTKYATLGDLMLWDYNNTQSLPGVIVFSFANHDGWCAIDRSGERVDSDKWVNF